jgi:hypothetical protein
MSHLITLIIKGTDGQVQKVALRSGEKLQAVANRQYQFLVDGREQLPPGTRIERSGQDLNVKFASGETVTITDWGAVTGSTLESGGATVFDAGAAGAVGAESAAAGTVGSGGAAAGGTTVAASSGGFSATSILIGAGVVAGVAALASGGGGGGGDSPRPAPSAPSGVALAAASDSGVAGDGITNDSTPTISGRGDPGSTIEVRNGSTVVATATVDASGNWSATPTTPLAEGPVTLSIVANTGSGTATSAATTLALTIDTAAPAVGAAPDMTAATDSGVSSTDNVTNNARPAFTIAAPGAGNTAALYVDGTKVAATFDAATSTLTPTTALAAGSRAITYTITDAAGNESARSAALTVTVDTAAPATAGAPDMTAATDSGASSTDNITSNTRPAFTIAAPGAGETAALLVDGVKVAATFDATTNTLTPTGALPAGARSVAYTLTDAAGNESPPSTALAVTVDTAAAAPSAPDLATASDTGVSGTDNLTTNSTPVFSGTGAEAGATVTLFDTDGTTVLGTAVAAAGGAWSITSSALAAGAHTVTAKQTDLAGNASAASAALTITVDKSAPTFDTKLAASEDFTSVEVSGASLNGADNFSKQSSLVVSSATFKSATGFVAGDVSIVVAGGKATVTPLAGAANKNGSIVLAVAMQDEAGNATTQDVTITVSPVNDAPAGADATVVGAEDTTYTFTVGNFGFTDANDSPANALQSVVVTTLPGAGTLKLSGVAVTAGQEITAADIAANKLTFDPVADQFGTNYASFTFQVRDNGGTALGGIDLDATPNKLTIDVTQVNVAPVLDASKSPVLAVSEYAFSGGGDAAVHAPVGAAPAGSVLVSSLIDFASPAGQVDNVTDPDTGAKLGVGVTQLSAASTGATLWYTSDGGTTWDWISNTAGSKVTNGFFGANGAAGGGDDNVLLLADTARIVFDGGNNGAGGSIADALTFRAWDQTSGTNGTAVTDPTPGGVTSLSAATDTVQANLTGSTIDLTRMSAATGVRIAGGLAGGKFGQDVATAGDVNGDGYDDFLISTYGTSGAGGGGATLVYGQAAAYGTVGTDGTRSAAVGSLTTSSFARPGEYFTGVSKLGDINNDGYADFILSGDLIAGTGAGNAWVVFGGASVANIPFLGVPSAGGGWFQISQSFYGLGQTNHRISWAGDVNGDGYDDLIVGMPGSPAAGVGTFSSGTAVVIYGHTGTNFGAGNNLDLVPFGVDPTTLTDNGGVAGHVLDAGTNTRGLVIGAGPDGNGLFWGEAVGGLGDRNGDGYGDFAMVADLGGQLVNAIGLHGKLSSDDGGNVLYLAGPAGPDWIGHGTGPNTGVNDSRIRFAGLGPTVGSQAEPDRIVVQGVGDVNGDGYDDFAIAYNGVRNGEVYVIYGNGTVLSDDTVPNDAAGLLGFKLTGLALGDKLGESVRAAGDVNGDGYDDFIVGAPQTEVGSAANQGGAYLVYGRADTGADDIDLTAGLAATRGVTIRGGVTADQAGFSVAGAGDVNGDGLGDLLVGAPLNDQGAADAGSTYLLYGSTAYGNAAGTVGASQTGTAAADSLVGTAGADTLSGGGGADAISGGRGNDTITVGDNGWRRVDGGAGFDTLKIGAAMTLDFTLAGTAAGQNLSGHTRGIERIDLGVGATAGTLKISEQDVYQLAGDFDVPAGGTLTGRQHNTLFVLGDAGDSFSFAEGVGGPTGWTTAALTTNPIGDGNNYVLYTRGTATVYVSTGISVADVIPGGPGAQTIAGGLGVDVIQGAGGNDVLYGGQLGSTAATSEAGVKDVFSYSLTANTASGADTIKDFQVGVDRLYLTDTVDTNAAIPGIEISDITQATSASQYVTFGTDGSGNVQLTITTGTGVSTVVLEGVAYEATATATNGAYGSLAELLGTGEQQILYLTANPFSGALGSLP